MKKIILLFMGIIIFLSGKSQQNPALQNSNKYPLEIEHLGIQHQYNIAKWFMYCISCDKEVEFKKETKMKDEITFGTLQLNFDHLEIRNDTIEIDFYFYYKNKQINAFNLKDFSLWGVVFKGKSDRPITYSSWSDGRYFMRRCESHIENCPLREVNPLQPDVIKYIKQNKEKIDPWFRKEAQKRGVIK